MDSEEAPLLVHKDPYERLDMKWVLESLTLVLSVVTVWLGGIPGYWTAIAFVALLLSWFWILTGLRGHLRSKWIKEVIDNNDDIFFDMMTAMDQGRALGLWSEMGHDQRMGGTIARYRSIRRQMLEQLDVILPACSSVGQINDVIDALATESQSSSGLRQIRTGRFAQAFREKGFGIDI